MANLFSKIYLLLILILIILRRLDGTRNFAKWWWLRRGWASQHTISNGTFFDVHIMLIARRERLEMYVQVTLVLGHLQMNLVCLRNHLFSTTTPLLLSSHNGSFFLTVLQEGNYDLHVDHVSPFFRRSGLWFEGSTTLAVAGWSWLFHCTLQGCHQHSPGTQTHVDGERRGCRCVFCVATKSTNHHKATRRQTSMWSLPNGRPGTPSFFFCDLEALPKKYDDFRIFHLVRNNNPSRIERDLPNGPLSKLLELLDTQV